MSDSSTRLLSPSPPSMVTANMKIGIYGGTFDPVHNAHLALAEACQQAIPLDEVWLIPNAQSPRKLRPGFATGAQRLAMLQAAIGQRPGFRVLPIEIDKPGPSYTVDTLRQLHHDHPAAQFYLLLGADSVADFPSWKDPREIMSLATIVAVNRGSDPLKLPAIATESQTPWHCVTMPASDLSASFIRRNVAQGKDITPFVPSAAAKLINDRGLYR